MLRQKIDLLVRKLFGAQSEKLDPAQLLLLLQGLDEPGKAPEPVAAEATTALDGSHRLRVNDGSRGCPSICR